MQLIGLTRAATLTTLTLTLSTIPVWSQTNQNSFKRTPILYSQSRSNRDLAEAHFMRGLDYAEQGKWDLALAEYNKAIAINSKYADAYMFRGIVYYEQDKLGLALADFNKAIAINPNLGFAYYLRGNVYANRQKWDLAVADYNKAIAINPNYAGAYNNRGLVYRDLGDINKAREDFQRAAQLFLAQGNTPDYELAIKLLNSL